MYCVRRTYPEVLSMPYPSGNCSLELVSTTSSDTVEFSDVLSTYILPIFHRNERKLHALFDISPNIYLVKGKYVEGV